MMSLRFKSRKGCFLALMVLVNMVFVSGGDQPQDKSLTVRVADKEPEWTIDLSAGETEQKPPTPKPPPPPPLPPPLPRKRRFSDRKRKRGRVTIDVQGKPFSLSSKRDLMIPGDKYQEEFPADAASTAESQISISADPAAAIRLARMGWNVAAAFSAAFMGTLRLLAPLIVARRAINTMGDLGLDYMRGRYIRKTYTRLEQLYITYYDLPASFRALCRTNAQLLILFILSRVMEWMVGIEHAPCRIDDNGAAMWCGLLWVFAVVGAGHACSTAVAVWGGPLRIQVDASHMHTGKSVAARVFTRPWHILQWMQDPEAWISMMSTPQTLTPPRFDPNPILFPATWVPLRLLQMIAVATAASKCPGRVTSKKESAGVLMKQFLIQLALSDEWYRVFLGEKRVGLGCFVAFCNFIATAYFVIITYNINGFSAMLLMPSLLAVIVSGWMNLVIFWNRLEDHRRQAAIDAFNQRKEAARKALKL